jgi:VanZ family protein
MFVPGRSPEWNDLVADAAGAAVAILVAWMATRAVHARRVKRGEV